MPPCLAIQCAEAEIAMGCERTHAQLVGQGEGLAVVRFSLLASRGIAVPGDIAEDVQGMGFPSSCPVGTGQLEGTPGALECLLPAAGEQIALAHIGHEERLVGQESRDVSM